MLLALVYRDQGPEPDRSPLDIEEDEEEEEENEEQDSEDANEGFSIPPVL